eukprot:175419_1
MDPSPHHTSIQSSNITKEHKEKLLHSAINENKTNIEFHLASSTDIDNDINITIDKNAEESISGDKKPDKKKTKVRDDDVDYVAIARGLSSKEKKLKFSRLIKQSAPEKHILCIGVL